MARQAARRAPLLCGRPTANPRDPIVSEVYSGTCRSRSPVLLLGGSPRVSCDSREASRHAGQQSLNDLLWCTLRSVFSPNSTADGRRRSHAAILPESTCFWTSCLVRPGRRLIADDRLGRSSSVHQRQPHHPPRDAHLRCLKSFWARIFFRTPYHLPQLSWAEIGQPAPNCSFAAQSDAIPISSARLAWPRETPLLAISRRDAVDTVHDLRPLRRAAPPSHSSSADSLSSQVEQRSQDLPDAHRLRPGLAQGSRTGPACRMLRTASDL